MREFQLSASGGDDLGAARGVATVFADIEQLATECRFSDCAHQGEPGCAVRDAVDDGRLDADRLTSYEKLVKELRYEEARSDPLVLGERKRVAKDRREGGQADVPRATAVTTRPSPAFFFTARLRGAFFGAGSFVGCNDTSFEENTLRPWSSNSITVWCSLTSTRVPLPYVACATRSPLVQDFIDLAYHRGSRRPPALPPPPRLP